MCTHRKRRAKLGTVVVGIFAAFTSRGEAVDPISVEVEATPFGGTTSGRLPPRALPAGSCAFAPVAPTVGTTYGGLGLRARVRQHTSSADPRGGFAVTARTAVEHQENETLREGDEHQRGVPPSQSMAAGSITLGYQGSTFGLHVGGSLRQRYGEPSSPCRPHNLGDIQAGCRERAEYPTSTNTVGFYPELALLWGAATGPHFELGVGAYTSAMLLRPGAHAGIGYATASGYDVTGRCGLQNTGNNGDALRCDLSGAMPLTRRVSVGLGGAVIDSATRIDFDGRATVTVRIGR